MFSARGVRGTDRRAAAVPGEEVARKVLELPDRNIALPELPDLRH
ncbi:hypothetical protein [Amycolatopsis sp. lyj-112]